MSRLVALLGSCVIVVTLTACYHVVVRPSGDEGVVAKETGPPPHAPAHGYRRKHQGGAELVFDAPLGVYVVVDQTEIYFSDGWFIRFRNGGWQVSASLGGPWKPRDADRVPPGLRETHHAKKRGRGHGPVPAKRGW